MVAAALGLQVFYLIDFCYFVNVATVVYLLWFPQHTGFEALVYAMSDGPLAGALVAWQCPWVFGSAEHTTRWVVARWLKVSVGASGTMLVLCSTLVCFWDVWDARTFAMSS